MKKSSEIRTLNRRYKSYEEVYNKLVGSGYVGLKKWNKVQLGYLVKEHLALSDAKRVYKRDYETFIVDSRPQTRKQLEAYYDNLKAKCKDPRYANSEIVQICKEYNFPDIYTKEQFVREAGGSLHKALHAAGLDDEAGGS